MSQINIDWYVAHVSFSSFTLRRTFKLTDFTSLEDIKYEIHYLLPYGDNRVQDARGCKSYVEYIFPFQNKSSTRVGSDDFKTGRRYSEDVKASTCILKCNVAFYVELMYVILILFYKS